MRDRYRRPDSTLPLLALAGLAALVVSFLRDSPPRRHGSAPRRIPDGLAAIDPGVAEGTEALSTPGFVRPAGAEAMRDRPRRWSKLDEEIDESFPASDPPGNY